MKRVCKHVSPCRTQLWCCEDRGSDACSIHGWVGVNGANQDLQLGLHPFSLLSICAHHCKPSNPLTYNTNSHTIMIVYDLLLVVH